MSNILRHIYYFYQKGTIFTKSYKLIYATLGGYALEMHNLFPYILFDINVIRVNQILRDLKSFHAGIFHPQSDSPVCIVPIHLFYGSAHKESYFRVIRIIKGNGTLPFASDALTALSFRKM